MRTLELTDREVDLLAWCLGIAHRNEEQKGRRTEEIRALAARVIGAEMIGPDVEPAP